MKPEDIMLSKMSHKKTNTIGFLLHEVSKIIKIIETDYRMVTRGWGQGEMGIRWLMSKEFQICKMKKILKIGFTTKRTYLTLLVKLAFYVVLTTIGKKKKKKKNRSLTFSCCVPLYLSHSKEAKKCPRTQSFSPQIHCVCDHRREGEMARRGPQADWPPLL